MINTLAPTKIGFDLAIEVRDRIFNLKNVKEPGGFVHIDIYDSNGSYIDEFCAGKAIISLDDKFDVQSNSAEFEEMAVKIFEYIDENIIF